MSTALLVSAFYDVGEDLYQNRRNSLTMFHERTKLPTGAALSLTHNQISCRTMGDTSPFPLSPDRSPPPANINNMISPTFNDNLLQSDLPLMASAAYQNHKLDRSISEPAIERKLSLGGQNSANSNQNINSSRYKTELCRPFEESGHCKYGDKCQFAHGLAELRTLARHPKYKTELCRTFHTIGFCPYGPRCHFIHNEDERRLSQIIQLKKQQEMTMHRPKALNFTAGTRDNLGSTADSPPSSITDSPTMSPTFLSDDIFASSFAPIPPASAPATIRNAFTFGDYMPPASSQPLMTPLNVATDPVINLTASLQATRLGQHDFRDCLQRVSPQQDPIFPGYAQPSPPESLSEDSGVSTCSSPLDVSRGLHLPRMFNRVSDDC
ncbi:hypothetical protein LSAT2_023104 [Lamellibrachia satsuma]|nr:hypothetical protein LSAT2_023104 [Lamellibrachia satsuma]